MKSDGNNAVARFLISLYDMTFEKLMKLFLLESFKNLKMTLDLFTLICLQCRSLASMELQIASFKSVVDRDCSFGLTITVLIHKFFFVFFTAIEYVRVSPGAILEVNCSTKASRLPSWFCWIVIEHTNTKNTEKVSKLVMEYELCLLLKRINMSTIINLRDI